MYELGSRALYIGQFSQFYGKFGFIVDREFHTDDAGDTVTRLTIKIPTGRGGFQTIQGVHLANVQCVPELNLLPVHEFFSLNSNTLVEA